MYRVAITYSDENTLVLGGDITNRAEAQERAQDIAAQLPAPRVVGEPFPVLVSVVSMAALDEYEPFVPRPQPSFAQLVNAAFNRP